MLEAALCLDSSPKEPGKDGVLSNVCSLLFPIKAEQQCCCGHPAFPPLLYSAQVIQGWKVKTAVFYIFCCAV